MIKLKLCNPLTILCIPFFAFSFLACDDNEMEKQPVITSKDIALEINENPQAGQLLAPLEATTDFGTVSYSVLTESVAGSFEVTSEVLLQNKGTRDTLFAFVALKNITEILEVENANVSTEENSAENTLLAELSKYITSDGDEFTYLITSLSVPNSIQIDEEGKVWIKDKVKFDYEEAPQITAEIKVKSGALEKTLTLIIEVTNIFDSEIYPFRDLIKLKKPTIKLFSNTVFSYNLGNTFKVIENNVFVSELGCAPTQDGKYTVTLYDAGTKQTITSIEVDVQGADSKIPKFFYTKLLNKIALQKDKEYVLAFYQVAGSTLFQIPATILTSPNSLSGISILKGVYAVSNNVYPRSSEENNPLYAVDMLLTPN
jgi:hypothetical protein